MCVDDDRDTCDLMEIWLENAPFEYDVAAVETTEQALELVERRDADLYILDSSVDGRPPLTLLETIRTRDETTPVIIVSGRADETDRDVAFEAGANEYLIKPAHGEDFVDAVERLLLQK